jgi:hypothetical protein
MRWSCPKCEFVLEYEYLKTGFIAEIAEHTKTHNED